MNDEAAGVLDIAVADANAARHRALVELCAADPHARISGEARTGREALGLLERERPDVVLMGTAMPEMDGLTTLRVVRATSDVPVIVLADELDSESMLDAVSLGATGYLSIADRARWEAEGLGIHLRSLLSADVGETISEIASAPDGQRAKLVTVPVGRIAGLAEVLRTGGLPLRHAVYALLDAPSWLVKPFARRLHRSTPWRVLAAEEGEVLPPGHALLSTLDAGLVPAQEGRRLRFTHRASWAALSEAVMAISTTRVSAGDARSRVNRARREAA